MVTQHYRWDFIGLSSYDKPTPETSEKVVDGSTYYEADTSKLYVFYKDTWYEKTATGGGGGGDITVVQTTGDSTTDVMSQKAVTDALAEAGGGFTTLTTDDYNWNSSTGQTGTPNCVALWLLPSGIYEGPADSSIDVRPTRTQDYSMGAGFSSYAIVKGYEGSNNRAIVTYFDGGNSSIVEYYSIGEDGTGYSTKNFPNVVQTTGTSTTNVMSQKAVTDALANAVTVNQVNATIDAINTALNTNIPHIGA